MGLLKSDLCIGCVCAEEFRCEGECGCAVEDGELTQLIGGEGGLEGFAPANDGDVGHSGAVEDDGHGHGNIVLCEGCKRGTRHARCKVGPSAGLEIFIIVSRVTYLFRCTYT